MKRAASILAVIILLLMWPGIARATEAADTCQEYYEVEIKLFFDVSSTRVNPGLEGNRKALKEIDSLLTTVINDSSWVVKRVSVRGSASPEGPVEFNRKLSRRRADAISCHFASYTDDASVPTDFHFAGANWDGMRTLVKRLPYVPDREMLVKIIDDGGTNRMTRIRRLSGGTTFRWLCKNAFPQLRASAVTLSLARDCVPLAILERLKQAEEKTAEEAVTVDTVQVEPIAEVEEITVAEVVTPKSYVRNIYFKTNSVAWAMGVSNIAVEADIVPHLSVTLPLYYAAWNYFTHKVKFRTFAFEPEVRAWLRQDNSGFFGGAHFGVAQYNMAIGGKYRFQDHGGNTPALGGGLSIGYRSHLGHSQRWMMEVTVGAGVYHLYYDVFDNSSVKYGQKLYEKHKTFFGIDNAGVTFIYALPLGKKGGVGL